MNQFMKASMLFSFIVCSHSLHAQGTHAAHSVASASRAVAVITPTKGNSVHGTVTFEGVEGGVRVVVELKSIPPGKHGFHIHEFGDLRSEDGTAAGGHYNPTAMPHSMPMSGERHMGDMGNIEAGADSSAHLEYVDPMMKLIGEFSVLGRSIIVHKNEDDLKTQPTGNAGARIGQGVIGIAK
jgi:Cu-Zn family superoxide dismutase